MFFRPGFCVMIACNRVSSAAEASPRSVCDARGLQSEARRVGRLSPRAIEQYQFCSRNSLVKRTLSQAGSFKKPLAHKMDEYSLWLQTNVSSARQDHVRAFADDLGDLLAMQHREEDGRRGPAARGRLRGRRVGAGDEPRRTSSRKRHRPQRRPPVGVGERARCPARFQRSRPCPPPARDQRPLPETSTNLRAERSPALAERASRRSRPSSRGS